MAKRRQGNTKIHLAIICWKGEIIGIQHKYKNHKMIQQICKQFGQQHVKGGDDGNTPPIREKIQLGLSSLSNLILVIIFVCFGKSCMFFKH